VRPGNTACRHHGHGSHRIGHVRKQRGQGSIRAVSSGFGALCDDHVGTHGFGPEGVFDGLHLTNQQGTRRADGLDVEFWIAEGEPHRCGPLLEDFIQERGLPFQRPRDEPHPDPRISSFPEFLLQPL